MAALSKSRMMRFKKYVNLLLDAKNEAAFKGGLACFDTATGLVAKGFVATTLIPIGTFHDDSAAAAGKKVLVNLFREINAAWFVNGAAPVVAADIGGLAYIDDDQTVSNTDATNTKSVLGRVWAIDTVKGVLVEPLDTSGQRTESGLDA